jgi:hypothetical protein
MFGVMVVNPIMKTYEALYSDFGMIIEVEMETIVERFNQNKMHQAIVSPFNAALDREKNLENLKKVTSSFRQDDFGSLIVDGAWIDTRVSASLHESILISAVGSLSFDDFSHKIQEILSEYQQDTFLAYDGCVCLTKIIKKGEVVTSFADFSLEKAEEYVSQYMKSGYEGRFFFERFRHPLGWIARMATSKYNKSNVIL